MGWVPVALLDELDFIPLEHAGRKEKGGVLKGSDDVSDYPLIETRIEGQTQHLRMVSMNVCW
ncbi:MAG: hypothetical protein EGP77_02675 [Lachnospiraceae bacterium]|nr:hypothetical protein [Lachnospiraceae bacterium]